MHHYCPTHQVPITLTSWLSSISSLASLFLLFLPLFFTRHLSVSQPAWHMADSWGTWRASLVCPGPPVAGKQAQEIPPLPLLPTPPSTSHHPVIIDEALDAWNTNAWKQKHGFFPSVITLCAVSRSSSSFPSAEWLMEIRWHVVAGGMLCHSDLMPIFDEMVLQKWCLDSRSERERKGSGVLRRVVFHQPASICSILSTAKKKKINMDSTLAW